MIWGFLRNLVIGKFAFFLPFLLVKIFLMGLPLPPFKNDGTCLYHTTKNEEIIRQREGMGVV